MIPSLYSTDDLDIVVIVFEMHSIFYQESIKIQGGKIKYHLLLSSFKVEFIELLRLFSLRNRNRPESVHHWCLGNDTGGCYFGHSKGSHLARFRHIGIVGLRIHFFLQNLTNM